MRLGDLISLLWFLGALLSAGWCDSCNAQEPLEFTPVKNGEVSPLGNANNGPQVMVIRNNTDWGKFWNQLNINAFIVPPRPAVDFSENVLVAVVDTAQPTGGHAIAITSIQPTATGVIVAAEQVAPGPNCIVSDGSSQPFQVVEVSVFSGEATLALSRSVSNCEQ